MGWSEIIEEIKGIEDKVERFADTLELDQLNEFNEIMEVLYRLISEANKETIEAVRITNATAALMSTDILGSA